MSRRLEGQRHWRCPRPIRPRTGLAAHRSGAARSRAVRPLPLRSFQTVSAFLPVTWAGDRRDHRLSRGGPGPPLHRLRTPAVRPEILEGSGFPAHRYRAHPPLLESRLEAEPSARHRARKVGGGRRPVRVVEREDVPRLPLCPVVIGERALRHHATRCRAIRCDFGRPGTNSASSGADSAVFGSSSQKEARTTALRGTPGGAHLLAIFPCYARHRLITEYSSRRGAAPQSVSERNDPCMSS
jgi:hypothetical protein